MYKLLIWDNDNHREIDFEIAFNECHLIVVEESGAGWLTRFPNDIVMIVKEDV